MKHLVIIGASGYGMDIWEFAKKSVGCGTNFELKGFLDLNVHALDGYPQYPKVIASYEEYEIQKDDVFVISIGDVKARKRIFEYMLQRGAEFMTLIHQTADIFPTSRIGKGCVILPYASVGSDVVMGENCLIQIRAIVAHNCRVGNHCRVDCNCTLVGGVVLKDLVTIHTNTVVSHKVVMEEGSTAGGMSFVIRSVKPGKTVVGIPAKLLDY